MAFYGRTATIDRKSTSRPPPRRGRIIIRRAMSRRRFRTTGRYPCPYRCWNDRPTHPYPHARVIRPRWNLAGRSTTLWGSRTRAQPSRRHGHRGMPRRDRRMRPNRASIPRHRPPPRRCPGPRRPPVVRSAHRHFLRRRMMVMDRHHRSARPVSCPPRRIDGRCLLLRDVRSPPRSSRRPAITQCSTRPRIPSRRRP